MQLVLSGSWRSAEPSGQSHPRTVVPPSPSSQTVLPDGLRPLLGATVLGGGAAGM